MVAGESATIASEAGVSYFPGPFASQASVWFEALSQQLDWQTERIQLFGRSHYVPHLTAFYGAPGVSYSYSGVTHIAQGWPGVLADIHSQLVSLLDKPFNCVLANLYRDGRDYMGWHSDDEASLGPEPAIASVSLGAPRSFQLRNKHDHSQKQQWELASGSVLLMEGPCQTGWQHCVPKRLKVHAPRINLTFRQVYAAKN